MEEMIRLYKCSGFRESCFGNPTCTIKSTFYPHHTWDNDRYIKGKEKAGEILKGYCKNHPDTPNQYVRVEYKPMEDK